MAFLGFPHLSCQAIFVVVILYARPDLPTHKRAIKNGPGGETGAVPTLRRMAASLIGMSQATEMGKRTPTKADPPVRPPGEM